MMAAFDFKDALGINHEVPHVSELFLRMMLAVVLVTVIAYRAWRRIIPALSPPFASESSLDGAQAQIIIAAAGALMVVIIGDNVARAFGLVGLGSFIRFRSGIKDPKDAAVLFVVIGIGMASGLGFPLMAASATLFVCFILMAFDATAKFRVARYTVAIQADDPNQVWSVVRAVYPRSRVVEIGKKGEGKEVGRLVVETELAGSVDALNIAELLRTRGALGINRVVIEL